VNKETKYASSKTHKVYVL